MLRHAQSFECTVPMQTECPAATTLIGATVGTNQATHHRPCTNVVVHCALTLADELRFAASAVIGLSVHVTTAVDVSVAVVAASNTRTPTRIELLSENAPSGCTETAASTPTTTTLGGGGGGEYAVLASMSDPRPDTVSVSLVGEMTS